MKLIKIKLNKNPKKIIEDINLSSYLLKLENEDRLLELPKPLLVYYVLDILYEEIMNGGFSQYIENQKDYTYKYLNMCLDYIDDSLLHDLITRYLNSCEYDDLDKEFVLYDEKYKYKSVIKNIYSKLYTEKVIYFDVEFKENENITFFNFNKKGVNFEDCLDSLIYLINKYSDVNWTLNINDWFGQYTISIVGDKNISLDSAIMFSNDLNLHNLAYFPIVRVINYIDNGKESICIDKSIYNKEEYMVEKSIDNINFGKSGSEIIIGATNSGYLLDYKKYDKDKIVNYLTNAGLSNLKICENSLLSDLFKKIGMKL